MPQYVTILIIVVGVSLSIVAMIYATGLFGSGYTEAVPVSSQTASTSTTVAPTTTNAAQTVTTENTPQSCILPETSKSAFFGVYQVYYDVTTADGKSRLIQFGKKFPSLLKENNVHGCISYSNKLWKYMIENNKNGLMDTAGEIIDFPGYGTGTNVQYDMYIHIHAEDEENIKKLKEQIKTEISTYNPFINQNNKDEKDGYVYNGGRDLTGFIDGTNNPKGISNRTDAAINKDGSSYVMVQRYIHDLSKWQQVDVKNQEMVIGRTKDNSTELNPLPPDSHVHQADQGTSLFIVRHSFPYGKESDLERGLWFTAYCKTIKTFDSLLKKINGMGDDKVKDKLMSYTKPVTGSYFFVPSVEMLSKL